jgi:hypothetical protein
MAEFRYQLKKLLQGERGIEVMLNPLGAGLGWSEFKSAHTGSRLPRVHTVNYLASIMFLAVLLWEPEGCLV